MVQVMIGLVFAAVILNLWGFLAKTVKTQKYLFIIVEVLLVIVLILGTVFANKG